MVNYREKTLTGTIPVGVLLPCAVLGKKTDNCIVEYAKGGIYVMEYSSAHRLAADIKASEEYQTYHSLKDEVMADETVAALIKEYKKLQITLQMAAISGQKTDDEDMQRFSGISSLLFAKPEVSQYLLAEMRMQQALADIFKIITEAADVDVGLPGMDG